LRAGGTARCRGRRTAQLAGMHEVYQEADMVSIDSSRGVRAPLQEKATRVKVPPPHLHNPVVVPNEFFKLKAIGCVCISSTTVPHPRRHRPGHIMCVMLVIHRSQIVL